MNENADPAELEKFQSIARQWWDPNSEFKPLHDINPLRMGYIQERANLEGAAVLDVGCGGGILSEAMARAGAQVTGIDMADKPLQVARLHLHESGLDADSIDYQLSSIEAMAEKSSHCFDVITCMEMLEHVPDPGSVIASCRKLLKPDGHLFLSTINRNPRSYLFMIVGAEYVLKMLPKGTHDYAKLIKPSELARLLRQQQFSLTDVTGMSYNPLSRSYRLGSDTNVNYLVYARPEPSPVDNSSLDPAEDSPAEDSPAEDSPAK